MFDQRVNRCGDVVPSEPVPVDVLTLVTVVVAQFRGKIVGHHSFEGSEARILTEPRA